MGISTITAGRILKGQLNGHSGNLYIFYHFNTVFGSFHSINQINSMLAGEEGYLYFERNLPNTALIKTYNVDR